MKRKSLLIFGIFVAAAFLTFNMNCKKETSEPDEAPGSDTVSQIETIQLSGTPAQNMIAVFELGVNALKNNSGNPDGAAAQLTQLLSGYNIADLRAKSKEAKAAGQGASPDEKNRYKALAEEYKKLAAGMGSKSPAFLNAHKEWSKAWGLK